MDRDVPCQIWTSSLQKWASKAPGATEIPSLYRGKLRGWSMKNRSKCNFFRSFWKLTRTTTYGQRSFWPNISLLTSKMSENNSGCVSSPIIISRKSKGVVHEKSVKTQCLQILLAFKPPTHIWIEIILAKYERPHFKNEREHPVLRRQPSHYVGEIVRGWSMKNRSKCNVFRSFWK